MSLIEMPDGTIATASQAEAMRLNDTAMGSRRHSHVGSKGDLRCEMHFIGPTEHARRHERQAALYVYRANHPSKGVFLPFGDMWRVVQTDSDGVGKIVKALAIKLWTGWCTKQDAFRLMDLLLESLDYLKNHPIEPNLDRSFDQFLADCEEADLEFFVEVNGHKHTF